MVCSVGAWHSLLCSSLICKSRCAFTTSKDCCNWRLLKHVSWQRVLHLQGVVLRFQGCTVYCRAGGGLEPANISLSPAVQQCVAAGDFSQAQQVGHLLVDNWNRVLHLRVTHILASLQCKCIWSPRSVAFNLARKQRSGHETSWRNTRALSKAAYTSWPCRWLPLGRRRRTGACWATPPRWRWTGRRPARRTATVRDEQALQLVAQLQAQQAAGGVAALCEAAVLEYQAWTIILRQGSICTLYNAAYRGTRLQSVCTMFQAVLQVSKVHDDDKLIKRADNSVHTQTIAEPTVHIVSSSTQKLMVQGKYEQAAAKYRDGGAVERAVAMFHELRMFEEAAQWSSEAAHAREAADKQGLAHTEAALQIHIKARNTPNQWLLYACS